MKNKILEHFKKVDRDIISSVNLEQKDTYACIEFFLKYYLIKFIARFLTILSTKKTGFSTCTCMADYSIYIMPFIFGYKLKSFNIYF